jgi:hypothetical protein
MKTPYNNHGRPDAGGRRLLADPRRGHRAGWSAPGTCRVPNRSGGRIRFHPTDASRIVRSCLCVARHVRIGGLRPWDKRALALARGSTWFSDAVDGIRNELTSKPVKLTVFGSQTGASSALCGSPAPRRSRRCARGGLIAAHNDVHIEWIKLDTWADVRGLVGGDEGRARTKKRRGRCRRDW